MKINEKVFLKKINKIINFTQKILIGFSGGLDSTVLLHSLKKIKENINKKIQIRAVYIDHNLNQNSKKWKNHCKNICLKWNIKFFSKKIDIKNFKKYGIECTARNKRYKIFQNIVLPKEIIVTAQHLNDQIETFFLALKRGSGPKGLSSMPIIKPFFNTYLVRPLLYFDKKKIFYYAKKNSLIWIEDKSNKNIKYDRNFLRLNIIPKLHKRWPFFLNSVFRSCKLCADQEKLIKELLKKDLLKTINQNGSLKIEPLKKYSSIKRNAIIRQWFKLHKINMPSYSKVKQIWKEIVLAKENSKPEIILNNYIISRFKKNIWIFPKFHNISKISLKWNINSPIELPDNLGNLYITNNKGTIVRAPKNHEKVMIKFNLTEKIKLNKSKKIQKSKNIWNKFNIPPWLRKRTPLIYYNDKLITALDVFITENGKKIEKDLTIGIKWKKNKNSMYKNINNY